MNKFRTLKANEIECRISQIKTNGLVLLLYKDARVDQNLLDETVGPLNWQRNQEVIDGSLYCTVSIWDDEKKQWVSKQDVGTESYTEKEKGRSSDAYKRACFNWGIGRELYTAPFIWISSDDCNIKDGKCYDTFEVTEIGYDDNREINLLEIVNVKMKNKVVYTFGKSKPKAEVKSESKESVEDIAKKKITTAKVNTIKKMCKDDNVPVELLLTAYKIKDLSDMTEKAFLNVTSNWEKVKAKAQEK